jgi:hypothetical protein
MGISACASHVVRCYSHSQCGRGPTEFWLTEGWAERYAQELDERRSFSNVSAALLMSGALGRRLGGLFGIRGTIPCGFMSRRTPEMEMTPHNFGLLIFS